MPDPQAYAPTDIQPYLGPGADDDIDPWDSENAIRAILPTFDDPRKADYLTYRVFNFAANEACILVDIDMKEVKKWRFVDPVFMDWESNHLRNLQQKLGPQLLYLQFTRNMHLALKADNFIMGKVAFLGVERLTKREFEWAKDAAKRYGPQELFAFGRALNPENGTGPELNQPVLNVNIGDSAISQAMANQALAQEVLSKFTVSDQIVEGESRVLDPSPSTN